MNLSTQLRLSTHARRVVPLTLVRAGQLPGVCIAPVRTTQQRRYFHAHTLVVTPFRTSIYPSWLFAPHSIENAGEAVDPPRRVTKSCASASGTCSVFSSSGPSRAADGHVPLAVCLRTQALPRWSHSWHFSSWRYLARLFSVALCTMRVSPYLALHALRCTPSTLVCLSRSPAVAPGPHCM